MTCLSEIPERRRVPGRARIGFTFWGWRLVIAAVLSGCFRVGIPEKIADPAPASLTTKRLQSLLEHSRSERRRMLVLTGCEEEAGGRPPTLGHQYLFGVFPLTSLFLEHRPAALLSEAISSQLLARGWEVSRGSCKEAARLILALHPDAVLEADLRDLRVNAYDLLLARRMVVSGRLVVRMSGRQGCGESATPHAESPAEPSAEVSRIFSAGEFVRFAHPPQLAAILQKQLESELSVATSEAIATLPAAAPTPCTGPSSGDRQVVSVETPLVSRAALGDTGTITAQSYGYQSAMPFTDGMVASIVRRGMAAKLAREFPVTETLNPSRDADDEAWHVTGRIESIAFRGETLRLTAVLQLRFHGVASVTARCSTEAVQDRSADGSWVVTLEHAAGTIAGEFFSGSEGSQVCQSLAADRSG